MKSFSLMLACAALSFSLYAAAPAVGQVTPELRLADGRVLREVVVLNYTAQALVARWQGGMGTILYRNLPADWRDDAERLGSREARQRLARDRERREEAREARADAAIWGAPPLRAADRQEAAPLVSREVELQGDAFISGGHTYDDQVIFSGMRVCAYPLREAQWAMETVMGKVEWPRPLASTATDSQGRWSLRVPAGVPFLLVAEGEHYATRTGRQTTWSWRIPSSEISDCAHVQLTDENAKKTWRVDVFDPRRDNYRDWRWQRR